MENLINLHQELMANYGPGFYILLGFIVMIGVTGQWMLYYKCDLPGVACIVPIWNVTTFLKIMGRPAWHIVFFLLPVYNIYFVVKVYIELCNSFGKNKPIDYALCLIFNGFYVLYLGLSDNTEYFGPVYGKTEDEIKQMQMA